MKHHRTRKHKRHTKRRHHSKRKTVRRGGAANKCLTYQNKLQHYREKLNEQSARTIEDFIGKVRHLYDKAAREGCSPNLLQQIEDFENGPCQVKANSLLRV